jgi:hypothetical protein
MGVNVKRGINRLYIVLAACWAVTTQRDRIRALRGDLCSGLCRATVRTLAAVPVW